MSIRPAFAKAIFSGSKPLEFRRVRTSLERGDRVLVYATAPMSRIVGEFRVGRVKQGTASTISQDIPNDELAEATQTYLRGARNASAIEVLDPSLWPAPLPFQTVLPGTRPPQSYIFVPENNGLLCRYP